jgi:hypothetical protein
MLFNAEFEELDVNPFESGFVEGSLGTYFWNFHDKQVIGPMDKKQLAEFTAHVGQLVDFDTAVQKRKGHNAAQVFRNHRYLRIMGFLKNGRYVHEGRGKNEAA